VNDQGPAPSPPPAAGTSKVIRCPSCGASITLRALGQSVMAACPACHTHLDVSQPEIRVIRKYQETTAHLHVPLGTRGTVQGQKYEVIGALQRSEETYHWHEYLLFNPYVGFRWLIWDHGHWNFGQPVKDTSQIRTVAQVSSYDGHLFRLFHRGTPTVDWVVGEFYWRVAAGDRAECSDYVDPPLMLSREIAAGEVNWTLLQYLQPAEVATAFGVSPEEPESIAANQPNPAAGAWRSIAAVALACTIAALAIQVWTVFRAHDTEVPLGQYYFAPSAGGREQVFGPFTLPVGYSLNEVTASVPLQNSWVELECSLVNSQTGASVEFLNAFEYYSGVDSDGAWSEGSWHATSLIPSVPAGTYNLVVEGTGQNEKGQPIAQPVQLTFHHDVAPWRNFWIAMGLILLYPAALLVRRYLFEKGRWAESEFGSSADDDNDN
jgi:hypothetical protein